MVNVHLLQNIYVGYLGLFVLYLWWVVPRGWNFGTIAGAVAFVAGQIWCGYQFYKRYPK